MKFRIYIAVTGLAIFIAASNCAGNEFMTENERYIKEAREKIGAFETETEAERLNEASSALENVVLEQEYDARIRTRLRSECLTLWLELVRVIDRRLDPKFDSEDVPTKLVQPPLNSDGTLYPPGADPALINDPKARAEYEKAIAENRAKSANYRIQIQLRRLNESIPPRAAEFIENSYTASDDDQKEVKAAIDRLIEDPARHADFSKLLKSSKP